MKKLFERAGVGFEGFMRRTCGKIKPEKRMFFIIALFALFALINLWVTCKAIYSIGREEKEIELIDLSIDRLQMPDEQMQDFIDEPPKTNDYDDTTEKK